MTRPLLSMIVVGVAIAFCVNSVQAGDPSDFRLVSARATTHTTAMRSDRVALVGGAITGQIIGTDPAGSSRPLSDVTVSFYRNGMLAAQVLAGADGTFMARLSPGAYTLVAYGPDGYCTYGIQAVADGGGSATMQVESLAIPPSDFSAAHTLARRYALRSMIGPAPTAAMDLIPAEPPMEDVNAPETSLTAHTVQLGPDGTVPGRLNLVNARSKSPMTAFLVQRGAVVKQASVAADGSFRFTGVAPGTYSFITAGAAGFSAFGVVIGAPSTVHASVSGGAYATN